MMIECTLQVLPSAAGGPGHAVQCLQGYMPNYKTEIVTSTLQYFDA